MMDIEFTGKPIPATHPARKADIDQMPDTPTRVAHHRRAHSETFFRLPDNLDDILFDDVSVDLLPPPTPPLPPTGGHPKNVAHLRSLSVDADFFDGLMLDSGGPTAAPTRHRHSYSMDGSEVDSQMNKGLAAADRVAELSLMDPKRAKRILANRQSAARSKERKVRYTSELERKVQTLQTEATTLSAQITVLQRDTTGLTAENKELQLKLQALEQQAHLRDALNEALRNEVDRLKIEAGEVPAVNRNRGLSSQSSSRPPPFQYFGNNQQQAHQMPNSAQNNSQVSGQSQLGFHDCNKRG